MNVQVQDLKKKLFDCFIIFATSMTVAAWFLWAIDGIMHGY